MPKLYQPTPTAIQQAAADLLTTNPHDAARIDHAARLVLAGLLDYRTAAEYNAEWAAHGLTFHTNQDPGWLVRVPADVRRNQGDDPEPRWYNVTWVSCQCWDHLARQSACRCDQDTGHACKHIYALHLYWRCCCQQVAQAVQVLDAAPSARYPGVHHLNDRDGNDICTATYDAKRDAWRIERDAMGCHVAAFAMWLAQQEQLQEVAR